MADTHEARLQRARVSLEGLSVGDGFGDQFFTVYNALNYIEYRAMPLQYWRYTDDTNMALSIYSVLRQKGDIDQDLLARSFAEQYHASRGYGPAMHGLLGQIQLGIPWQMAAKSLFSGQGSYGNGAAMRITPLGAYFADDMDAVVEQAHHSAEITHAHSEGVAGAIAVAIATAVACHLRKDEETLSRKEFLDQILPYVPDSIVREKIRHARDLADGCSVGLAIAALGNGTGVSAQDTVPFVLCSAGERLDNYEEAIWQTASGGGDVDTTCAMVGGIVSMLTGLEGIPVQWIESREPLPEWAFTETD